MRLKLLLLHFLIFGLSFGLQSCKEDAVNVPSEYIDGSDTISVDKPEVEQTISLKRDTINAQVGDTLVIKPTFGSGQKAQKLYTWNISNEDVAKSIFVEDDYALKLVVKQSGDTKITIISDDGKLQASCFLRVDIEDDGIIRILAIGNSFSEDALEHYFYGLNDAAGKKVIIGNMYIGGASLALHWDNAVNNKKAYDFRRIDENGNKTNTPHSSIAEVLASENWNYVSLQQVSHETGQYSTYVQPFPKLYDYVKEHAMSSAVKIIFHQVWAYQQGSTHPDFGKYNNDQMTMYKAIVDAVWKADDLLRDIDIIVPAGTAIQNGRATLLGDNFNRDGYHLNALGQYTAACTWFEAIFGENVIGNSFVPDDLTVQEIEIAQHAAHAAVEDPKEVTLLEDYEPAPPQGIQDAAVWIGFGSENITNYPEWNAFSGPNHQKEGNRLENLVDENTDNTGVSIEIITPFNGRNDNGIKGIYVFDKNIPDDIAGHSYFGNSTGSFGDGLYEEVILKVSNLDKDETYDFCYYGSREAGGVRETKFVTEGANSAIVSVDAVNADIDQRSACATGVQPDSNGEIHITIRSGDNNDTGQGFYYLNFMKISKLGTQTPNPPSGIQDYPVLIGFGSESSPQGWNVFLNNSQYGQGNRIDNLLDYNSTNTGVSIEITESFNERNNDGKSGVTLMGINIPDEVATHSYYGNGRGEWLGKSVPQSKLKISNLDVNKKYDFCFYGSRNGVGDNRETKYIVDGINSKSASINTSNNGTELACVEDMQPDNNGEITITVTMGDNNDNGSGFFYLNLMSISSAD